jgi:ferredoxin-NADP reductase
VSTFKVASVRFHTDNIIELSIDRNGIAFTPGDCVAISNADGISRPYSVCSGVDEPELRFVIRCMPGGVVSQWLAALKPEDDVEISPPFGWFRPGQSDEPGEPSVFFATGTGVAPFLSALRSHPELKPKMMLYGVRRREDAIALDYLEARTPLKLSVSGEDAADHHHGRISDRLNQIPMQENTHYYLCGLDAMIDEISEWLEQRDVHFTNIHREVFFNA